LPGLFDLAGQDLFSPAALAQSLAARFAELLHAELVPDTWTNAEQQRIEELKAAKYQQAAWNEKR
jgi:lipoate-protein ligase A